MKKQTLEHRVEEFQKEIQKAIMKWHIGFKPTPVIKEDGTIAAENRVVDLSDSK